MEDEDECQPVNCGLSDDMNDIGVSRRKKRNLKRPIESESSSEAADIVPDFLEQETKKGLNKFFTKSESSQS
jgi:hypothetical protein